jgi:hypothetical protein
MSAVAGHNHPPSQIELIDGVVEELSRFLSETPVIGSHEEAKRAAELIKRGRIAADELDDERDGNVRPLNERVKAINAAYKRASLPLDRLLVLLKSRLTDRARAEEARRQADVAAKLRAAQEAEIAALRAAEAERDAIENAALGEIGGPVVQAITDTAIAQEDAARAARALAIAEKDVPERIATGYGRAVAMRTVETLVIDNHISAVISMWPSDKIGDAIRSAARDYRKAHGRLPKGISIHIERKI